ncbi:MULTISPECIES: sigma-70 family RNA polymerase sigma factor [Actinomadura]|uniref:Sigma-70 family RNA polymerase sigma factor n=2 Tax=Actinomadura yumaensis TaxID=111807 RepID=A0ABW2CSC6_9ACTN|nr:sigma-70 family RNA polymerase sigma factor [Actinomadura sp. J1-007]
MNETASHLAPPETSDAVLISRIRDGDVSAYGALYERHLGAARGLARHLVEGDAAEDAVQETFAKILDVLRRGGGPDSGFRPYLLTSVRRTVYDRYRAEKRVRSTDQIELYDAGAPFEDPAVEGLERSMIVRAFRSLPERWQAVLWHTEIEGAKPADVAPLLGLTANGTAALAYRAREGLRQAYLQMHLSEPPGTGTAAGATVAAVDERCRPALDKLGSYVRGGLAKRDARAVEAHLDGCSRCKGIYTELADVNSTLREVLGPAVLGSAATAYLAAVAAGQGGTGAGGILGWFRRLPKRQQQGLAGATVAAAALAVLGLVLVSGEEPIKPVGRSPIARAPAEPARPAPNPPAAPAPPAAPPPAPAPKPAPKPVPKSQPQKPTPNEPKAKPPAPVPPPPATPARMTARIGPVGTLLRNQPGIVAMAVRNGGAGRSDDVVADIDLPPDVTYAGAPTGRNAALFTPDHAPGDGWTCRPTAVRAPAPPPHGNDPYDASGASPAKKPGPGTHGKSPRHPKRPYDGDPRHGSPDTHGNGDNPANRAIPKDHASPDNPENVKSHGNPQGNSTHAPPVNPATSAKPGTSANTDNPANGGNTANPDNPASGTDPKSHPNGADPADLGKGTTRANRVRCTHAPMKPSASTTAYLHVNVGPTAPYDTPPQVTLRAGGAAVTAKAPEGVASAGLPARFAADGNVRTVETGNALLSCDERSPECRGAPGRKDGRRDNDFWRMCLVDDDHDRTTRSSSAARLALPARAKVLWAGLYWSGVSPADGPVTARLRGPGGTYRTLTASRVGRDRLPGDPAYQAFADVTGLVARHGAGTWWAADVPTREGVARYAGWSLVTVVRDPAAPHQQAMVLDGVRALGAPSAARLDVPVNGLVASARPARIGVVTWEGDAGLPGDRVLLDGRALAPATGGRSPDNVSDGSASGAIGRRQPFGVDVDHFMTVLDSGRTLSLVTGQDALLAGVVTVTAPMRG